MRDADRTVLEAAMDRELSRGTPFADDASDELIQLQLREEKRRYIREYMRRWRSRPDRRQIEHQSRRRCYRERKVRCAAGAMHSPVNSANASMCAICRKRPSTTTIVRLRLLDKAPYNYAEMRVPYCGEC
jgi:hypothetical protein